MNEKETSRNINSNEYREANVNDDGTYVEGDYQNNSGGGDNVGGNKTEYHYHGNGNQQEAVKREKNQQTLLDWIETEVNSRLKQSLHNHISILLDKEEDPLSVSPFWEMELKVDTRKQEKLPSGTTVYTVYDREDIQGRLLILGEPGSGKTTTLLQLAKVLVERAKNAPNQPIPMLFNLSAWKDDKQSIHEWIIDTLKAPPYGIKKELSDKWLQEGIILPLLDGLDELASNRQKLCIDKLNKYLGNQRAQLPLVICSRVKEFKHNQTKLFLNGSIILQPLREEQIKDYIERTEGIALWEEIEQDAELLDLCKVPFFLSVIVIACGKISLKKWQNLESSEEKKNYILETYINQMLARTYQGRKYDDNNTKYWLGWLAVKLNRENEKEFLIENIQPYWLENKYYQLIFYHLNTGFITSSIFLITPIISHIHQEHTISISLESFSNLWFLFIATMMSVCKSKIKPIEIIKLSSLYKNKTLIKWLIIWLTIALIIRIFYKLIEKTTTTQRLESFLENGGFLVVLLLFVLLIGILMNTIGQLINIIIESGIKSHIDIKNIPNQGIKESAKNAIKASFFILLIAIILLIFFNDYIIYPLMILFNVQFEISFFDFSQLSLFILLISMLVFGYPAIQHFSLRIVITLKNYAPWNYAKFLDYATNRLFLQRVGGGYQFIHRMLQEHFASYQ